MTGHYFFVNSYRSIYKNTVLQDVIHQKEFSKRSTPGLIPYCSKIIARQDRVKKTSVINSHDTRCSDFLPRYTNHGLCLTRNGASLNHILKPSSSIDNFKEIFNPLNSVTNVQNISMDSSDHQFGFLIDANRYKDLKRGVEWNNLGD